MKELSLAELIPLWRTLREEGVTALVTPALDYVGALELTPLDIRYAAPRDVASVGESLRSVVSSLDDESSLLFLYRVDADCERDVLDYEESGRGAPAEALRLYVASRAAWLRGKTLRRTRVYVFFSLQGEARSVLSRGHLGVPLLHASLQKRSREAHLEALKSLGTFRDRLAARLSQSGVTARELQPSEVQALHYELLNPTRARQRLSPPSISVRDNLWDGKTIRAEGEHLREYTEAEQLTFESIEDGRGAFRHGDVHRRVATLKVLPEGGTGYAESESLMNLAVPGTHGESTPFPYTIAVAVNVRPQGRTKWLLDKQHGLVDALKNALPFFSDNSAARQVADASHKQSIEALFRELQEMSSKLVTVSVSILLEALTPSELDAMTEAARAAFNRAGNSELLIEDVAQIPAFLSMLPGGGPYQLRKKACTSRNAADFLPLFAPWRGSAKAASLLLTPTGDAFRFDPFDPDLATAHHGLIVADTGSGKSVSLGALTLDALAAGTEAVLIDNGNSWKRLTELCGGVHIPVDIKTSISPFVAYAEMLDAKGELDNERIQDVVSFLEVCVTDRSFPTFDKVAAPLVARAVRHCYEQLRAHPEERPLVGHFREALRTLPMEHADDRRIAEEVCRRLYDFCEGVYAEFLNRPSNLRFDARLLTFDLQAVSKSPTTKSLAMATIIQAIGNRAMRRRARTLVEVDEGHELLGTGDAGEKFLEGCYRKMRKYGVAMWMISQQFNDFKAAKSGPAIIGNSKLKIFLRHDSGHEDVINYFGLSPRAAHAFKSLRLRKGHYSDFLLMYGQRLATARLALHPLALWILTTDKDDADLLARARERNPRLSDLELIERLAALYPNGARGQLRIPSAA